jgi:Zn finger protein HypA/HybF involved in hydrogenase expression
MEENTKTVQVKYRELREWLACPNCQSRDAKVEKGSIQLFCPNCKTRQNLIENSGKQS